MFGGADLEAVGMPRTRIPFYLADDKNGHRSLDGSDAGGVAIASPIHADPMKAPVMNISANLLPLAMQIGRCMRTEAFSSVAGPARSSFLRKR